jgi:hypothetical protein
MGMEEARAFVEEQQRSREKFIEKMGGPDVVDWITSELYGAGARRRQAATAAVAAWRRTRG